MSFFSFSNFISSLCSLILLIHSYFLGILAFFLPFLEPWPFLLPLAFCILILFVLEFDIPLFGTFDTKPSITSARMSAFVIASFIWLNFVLSKTTLFGEHFSTDAAILFWTFSFILALLDY